jgi:hypothetical protein
LASNARRKRGIEHTGRTTMSRFGFLSVSAIAAIALAVIPTEIVA